MDKGTTIISDLNSFFSKGESNRALYCMTRVMERIKIRSELIGVEKKKNCKFTTKQVLDLLLLFPFFAVKNAFRYSESSLSKLFKCKKDMFYRFMNDGNVKWRELLYSMNHQLIKKISCNTNEPKDNPICLIVDDTDIPKTGMKTELIGKVFSHVKHAYILGYKCLTLMMSDGKSHIMLDFSLHGERGSDKNKIQGLTAKQRKERFSEDHRGQVVEKRVKEYKSKKTDKAMDMIKHAIKQHIRFDYLLVDSWFISKNLVHFIKDLNIDCHLLGMIKMGVNTLYETKEGMQTAKDIVKMHKNSKSKKYNRRLHCTCFTIEAKLDGVPVKLFFSKMGRKGEWKGMLSTNLSLSFDEAYRLYARRWNIEVAYKDCKSLLSLDKCQSHHFSAQIASISLTFMQYNILCTVKRFEAYETIGGLFANVADDTLELSVTDKIWKMILDTIMVIAENFSLDATELLHSVISNDPMLQKLRDMYIYTEAS